MNKQDQRDTLPPQFTDIQTRVSGFAKPVKPESFIDALLRETELHAKIAAMRNTFAFATEPAAKEVSFINMENREVMLWGNVAMAAFIQIQQKTPSTLDDIDEVLTQMRIAYQIEIGGRIDYEKVRVWSPNDKMTWTMVLEALSKGVIKKRN